MRVIDMEDRYGQEEGRDTSPFLKQIGCRTRPPRLLAPGSLS